jgi:poly(3-hydroxybutyrate) depolymerase
LWLTLGAALGCGQTANNAPSTSSGGSSSQSGGNKASAAGDTSMTPTSGTGSGGSGDASGGSGGGTQTRGGAAGEPSGGVAGTPAVAGGSAGGGGSVGSAGSGDILAVKPSPGCGTAATQALGEFVRATVQTSGVKDPACADKLGGLPKCGPWSLEREYFVWLPPTYDKNKAYPLVVQGGGCGSKGTDVYALSSPEPGAGAGVGGSVIRVGITPAPNSIGHGTNENQGCFDDKEGNDSVDLVLFETLLDKLKTQLCYDENRVFVSGNSSGSWIANELTCKYAGDTHGHSIRGLAANQGGLPSESQYAPTCSEKPAAGIYTYVVDDLTGTNSGSKFAIAHMMKTNGCTSTNYDEAVAKNEFMSYPIGGSAAPGTCRRLTGCQEQYPIVVCPLPPPGHVSNEKVVDSAFAAFFKDLAAK